MKRQSKKPRLKLSTTWPMHLLLLPGVLIVLIFNYIPMVGISIAFQNFKPTKGFFGSKFVGLKHFKTLFTLPQFNQVVFNTLFISILKIVSVLLFATLFALLLNELRKKIVKVSVQSFVLFPFFVSWVIMSSIIKDLLYKQGAINEFLTLLGVVDDPIFFMGNKGWFLAILIITNLWKEFGYNSIIIAAALTNIDKSLYEAAYIDGANRWKQTLYITLPGITPILVMLMVLSLGNILNAGFDQIYNLYNSLVLNVSDIIDTYVYRVGVLQGQYSLASAAGIFKSLVGIILLTVSYRLAYKYTDYRIF